MKNNENLELKTVKLPDEKYVSIDVGLGYSLVSTEATYQILPDSDTELTYGRNFHLINDGTLVFDFLNPDLGIDDAIRMGLQYRQNLFKEIKPILAERENPSKVEWIRKNFVREPMDVPPWKRTVPARSIAVKLDDINWDSLNDEGNASRFEQECRGYLLYNLDSKRWNIWTDNYWDEEDIQLVLSERFVSSTLVNELQPFENLLTSMQMNGYSGTDLIPCKNWVSSLRSHLNYSKKESSMKAMASICAKSTMGIHMNALSDSDLLACKNGIIDTKEGKFYPMWEADKFKFRYPTHYIDCTYTGGGKPELFLKHLHTIFNDNTTPDLKDYEIVWREEDSVNCFKRLLGYLLIVGNPEQLFIFFWGTGANGKSTTIDVLRRVLGEEIAEASAKELYETKEEKPSPGIARGLPYRVLLFSEMADSDTNDPRGPKIDTMKFKNLTGDAYTRNYRALYKEGEDQQIVFTPIAPTNELPHFNKDLNESELRRSITVPHPHIFSGDKREKNMVAILLKEKDEIFSMMVDEMIAYRKGGLVPIPEHWKAMQAQLFAGDAQYAFINETYQKTDGSTPEKRTAMRVIESYYINWCRTGMVDCSTVMKSSGIDANGYARSVERLSNGEVKKMHKAFKAMGYTIRLYGGAPYVWCEFKSGR